jgi:hypothetical protein
MSIEKPSSSSKKRAKTSAAGGALASGHPAQIRRQRFAGAVQKAGTKHYLEIPFDPNTVWGEKDRHYVSGTIDSCRIRGVLIHDGSQFVLSLWPAWLRDNAVSAGGTVKVELEPVGPLIQDLERDVALALASDPDAKRFFESVAPFYRKNAIRWIESAKRAETRAARIVDTVRMLAAGKTM